MKSRLATILAALSIFAFCCDNKLQAQIPASKVAENSARGLVWDMAPKTVIVFNTAVQGSAEHAQYYAEQRKIPGAQILGIDCPTEETITRAQFDATIRQPLRKVFTDRGWWQLDVSGSGHPIPGTNRMRVLTLIKGVPLRIAPGEGEPEVSQATPAASVDSELTLLQYGTYKIEGPQRNVYFRQNQPFNRLAESPMFLVGRLDGPNFGVVRNMIDGAIEAEKKGLWGLGYVDLAAEDRPGYMIGDQWLKKASQAIRQAGIPVVEDNLKPRFPLNYPMGQAALYFGWYTQDADGPFLNSNFKMRPGGVAVHIHSYSAATLRDSTKHWCGPILERGAAATLGNVYEPFLSLTPDLGLFTERLLAGYSFGEAAWMSQPMVSWMTTVIGDPLYRPFGGQAGLDDREDSPGYKAYQVAHRAWGGGDPSIFIERVEKAGKAGGHPTLLEALGLYCLEIGDNERASDLFNSAAALYTEPQDKLRMALHGVDLQRRAGNGDNVERGLELIDKAFAQIPEGQAARAMLLQINPPPPPLPEVPKEVTPVAPQ